MSVSGQDYTILKGANDRGESYALANRYALTAGHVVFSLKFKKIDPHYVQITPSVTHVGGYAPSGYMDKSYESEITSLANKYADWYNSWYFGYHMWLGVYGIWQSKGSIGTPPPFIFQGKPPYGAQTPASGAITPQQAAQNLLRPPTENDVFGSSSIRAIDSIVVANGQYHASKNDPGLVLFNNPSDFFALAGPQAVLLNSSQHFEIGDSSIGQSPAGEIYPSTGSKQKLVAHVVGPSPLGGATFALSTNAYPGNSGSGGILSWTGVGNFVFGNMVSTPPAKPLHILGDGNAEVQVGAPAKGVFFTPKSFENLNTLINGAIDPANSPMNMIVGVDHARNDEAQGTARRDLFIGTTGKEVFRAGKGDVVDVGAGDNVVIFSPDQSNYNGFMTVEFGRTSKGEKSGNTVVDTKIGGNNTYVLD
ncbi:MAG: hypothetical protein ABI395_02300 [Sphingobium sp.]